MEKLPQKSFPTHSGKVSLGSISATKLRAIEGRGKIRVWVDH